MQLVLILGATAGVVPRSEFEFVLGLEFQLALELRLRLGLELEPWELQLGLVQLQAFLHLRRFSRLLSEQQVRQGEPEPEAEHLPNSHVKQLPVPEKIGQ